MEPKKSKRLVVEVSPEEHARLKSIAAIMGETMREILYRCVRAYIEDADADEKRKGGGIMA